jgi:hypothetical protein
MAEQLATEIGPVKEAREANPPESIGVGGLIALRSPQRFQQADT